MRANVFFFPLGKMPYLNISSEECISLHAAAIITAS
jgi:hypothetical protein